MKPKDNYGSFYVHENTPEQLKKLEEDGFYPGKEVMEMRGKIFIVDSEVIPVDARCNKIWRPDVDTEGKKYSKNKTYILFTHRYFPSVEEGAELPIINLK